MRFLFIARAILPGRFSTKHPMGAFAAYFDDSGKDNQGSVVVCGGAVSTVDKWDKLTAEWVPILAKYGLTELHMKTVYRDIGKPNADSLVGELADCIKRRTNKTFGCAVLWKDWRKVNRKFRLKEEIGTPFPFAALGCLSHLQDWAKKPERAVDMADIPCIFEHGSEGMAMVRKICKREFGIDILEGGKSIIPLQVADFVAWHNRRHMDDIMSFGLNRPAALPRLRRSADLGAYFSLKEIEELAIRGNIAVR